MPQQSAVTPPGQVEKKKEKKEEEPKEEGFVLSSEFVAHVEEQVLMRLGVPDDFVRVAVKPLWENRVRVNVYVKDERKKGFSGLFASIRISDSFFLIISPEGGILKSLPEIKRNEKYDEYDG